MTDNFMIIYFFFLIESRSNTVYLEWPQRSHFASEHFGTSQSKLGQAMAIVISWN